MTKQTTTTTTTTTATSKAASRAKAAPKATSKATAAKATNKPAQAGITLQQIAALSLVAQRFFANGLSYHMKAGSIEKKDGAIYAIGKLSNRVIKHETEILKSLKTGVDTPQGGKMVAVKGSRFPYHLADAYLVSGRHDSQAIFSLMLRK